MDLNTVRIIITVASFACFIGIVLWAYSRDRQVRFDEAAQLPFADEEIAPARRATASESTPAATSARQPVE